MIFADLILVVLVLLALLISSFSDIKTFEVPDFVSYSLIISSLFVRLINSIITKELNYFLYGLLGFLIMFVLAHVLYYAKFWGGGDSKLLMGLGSAFGTKPYFIRSDINFLLLIVVSIVIIGSIYGLIYSIALAIKHKKEFNIEFLKLLKINKLSFPILIFVILFFTALNRLYPKNILFTTIFIIISYIILHLLYLFVKSVENSCMHELVPVSKLTVGDWIADSKITKKYEISYLGIEKHQIELLKKAKLKGVLIKKGIAFTPAILIGVLFALIIF